MFDPNSLTSTRLNELRAAAESAWGDDTRHEGFVGHPQPSAGNCFVTAQWLKNKLGGHVATKHGHYFWLSPDRHYALDLTGEQCSYPPADPSIHEPGDLEPHHMTWRPGPVLYQRADSSLFKGARVIDDHSDHPRAKAFARKADLALNGKRVASVHVADMGSFGPSGFQGPQQQEDMDIQSMPFPMLHDEPGFDPASMSQHEYKWVYANGQLHVSPHHGHEELFTHAGADPDSSGPVAVGYVTTHQNHALWEVNSNISLRGLHDILKDYSDTVGWDFDGMIGADGNAIHDDFGPKSSMWYRQRKDGHLLLSHRPLPNGKKLTIAGKKAYAQDWTMPALRQWADDQGFKLAEYPGGGNMLDQMKNREHLDLFNRGDPKWQPEPDNPDQDLGDHLECGDCGAKFDRLEELRVHERYDHRPQDYEEIPDGHFPQIDDFDAPLPFRRRQPFPNWGETVARHTAVMALPSHRMAARHPRFDLYASLFGYDNDDGHQFYGAYRNGQLVGYGAVRLNGESEPEVLMIDAVTPRSGVGSAILSLIQTHYDSFYTHADSKAGERLMARQGMVNVEGQRWRWSKGSEPKDMLEADVPFLFDAQRNWIEIGYPGQSTHDISNRKGFTAGAIVEGYYQPGGKLLIIDHGMNMPYTTHQLAKVWYHRFPQMQITQVEREDMDGKPQKIAAASVGNYVRSILPTDPPAYAAYQALRDAGGKVYAVGGAIRDALQQREPNDLDLMVGGLPPEEVAHVLSSLPGRVDLTGKRFGVYRYKVGGRDVEIALPRQDKYETSRRGEGVVTVDHNLPVDKDLERRDFTANSMAVDLDTGQLIDPFNGAHDSANNILRTTHPDSFHEDPSRLVRALAMHGRFGLNPDERTRHEMETHGHLLRGESPDAINKILTEKVFGAKNGNPAGSIRLAKETGILRHLFPKLAETWEHDQNNSHHAFKLGEHSLQTLDNMAQLTGDPDMRMAALNHDIGKPDSEWVDENGQSHYYQNAEGQGANHEDVGARHHEEQLRNLNFPVARINKQLHVIKHHMFPAFNSPKGARKFINRVGDEHADDMLNMREADMGGKGQGPEYFQARTSVDQMRNLVNQARTQQAPTALNNLSVNGNDLIAMGLKPGPQIGAVLNQLMEDVVNEPALNERDALLNRARQYVAAQPA